MLVFAFSTHCFLRIPCLRRPRKILPPVRQWLVDSVAVKNGQGQFFTIGNGSFMTGKLDDGTGMVNAPVDGERLTISMVNIYIIYIYRITHRRLFTLWSTHRPGVENLPFITYYKYLQMMRPFRGHGHAGINHGRSSEGFGKMMW